MPHIEGRKGEVTLPDGRIVSQQRAEQLRHPEAYRKREQKWLKSDAGKVKPAATQRRYRIKHKMVES